MPQATAEDKKLLTDLKDVVKKFPIMTETPKGQEPRSAGDCVIDMVMNIQGTRVANYYREFRNRQKNKLLQILGTDDIHITSAIYHFFTMQDNEYKETIKTLERKVTGMQTALNSLHRLSMTNRNINALDRERLRNAGDKLFEMASRLAPSEDQLIEMGEIKRLEMPADVRTPDELVEVLIKFYMEVYAIYPDYQFTYNNPFTPKELMKQGQDLERNLRRCAEYIRMIYKESPPSRIVLEGQNNTAPGDFAKAVYLGLVNLDNAGAAASAAAAAASAAAAAASAPAAPAAAPKKKGWFSGGNRNRKTRRSKKGRSKRRQTRSRR